MAQHTVVMKAIDSYVKDHLNNGAISRGSTLVGQEVGTATGNWSNTSGEYTTYKDTTNKQIFLIFPSVTPTEYRKKHLVSRTQGVYVTAKSATYRGGHFSEGPYFAVSSYPNAGFSGYWGNNLPSLPLNAYFENDKGILTYTEGYVGLTVSAGIDYDYGLKISFDYSMSVTIQSHSEKNPPYRKFIYEDVPIIAKGTSPINVYINPYDEVNYGFSIEMEQTLITEEPLYIEKAKFQFRFGGEAEIQDVDVDYGKDWGSKNAISTFLTTAFPKKSYFEWRVSIMSDDGIWSEPSPWYYVNTTDGTSYSTPTDPVNAYIDGTEPVYLRWTRSISTGTAPKGADFQVSTDNGVTWRDLGHTEGYADFRAEPGMLPAGNVLWRVRSYNQDDVAGPWSNSAAIVVRQAPATPGIVGITTVPKPTVLWNAEDQQAYQLQVGDWDSGTVFSTAKVAQTLDFIPDGETLVRLRVQNSFGLWSKWAESTVIIQNRTSGSIQLQTKAIPPIIRLSWNTEKDYPEYLIYRDGKYIGASGVKEFTDFTGNGKAVYFVRGVDLDSTYTDSSHFTEILRLKSGYIAVVGEWNWIPLNCRRGKYPGIDTSEKAEITYAYYSGREYPVAEISGHSARQHTLYFTFRRWEEMLALRKMKGQLVVYKDFWGRVIIGILENLEITGDWAYDVSFTIVEVDHAPVL